MPTIFPTTSSARFSVISEMALRDRATSSRLRWDLENILTAGERGRALVDARAYVQPKRSGRSNSGFHVEKVVRGCSFAGGRAAS